MSDIAIKVEGLGKQYRLGEIGTGTISHDLNRWFARLRGKEDPFAKVGETNDRTTKGSSDYVWSLKDVDFEVKKGEVLGIIGRNGAGKSTLLKILSKVTAPTTGNIKVNGRIASLLEVGTGFHPELTGRENIFLNGAILGMTKAEIRSKFDEIVDFSGVERYIDTPVKRYSSGMYVRLAFAVAAFLEPEILIVDEVLAVGDAEFQKKCIGRMKDVSVNDGRTVLFVSHNMSAVKQLCTQGLFMKNGTLDFSGDVSSVIDYYNSSANSKSKPIIELITRKHAFMDINYIHINGQQTSPIPLRHNKLHVEIKGVCLRDIKCNIEIQLLTVDNTLVSFYSPGHIDGKILELEKGEFTLNEYINIPVNIPNGEYYLNISLALPNVDIYMHLSELLISRDSFATNTGKPLSYTDVGFFLMERDA